MKSRALALLLAVPALVAGLLVAAPSGAATYYSYVPTKTIAISSDGIGYVRVTCHSSHTCSGKLTFVGGTRTRSYSVAANSSKIVEVAVRTTEAAYPYVGGTDYGDYSAKAAVLHVNEDTPANVNHDYNVTTETLVKSQQIRGTVTAAPGSGAVTGLKVELIKPVLGGNTTLVRSAAIASDGTFYLGPVPLGLNNVPSSIYKIRISGTDEDGTFRSWWYRGSDGLFTGGGRYLRDAGNVVARKDSDYNADFRYARISGSVTGASTADVTVAAAPPGYSTSASTLREYDIPSCADIFGKTTTVGGNYSVDFLPAPGAVSSTDRYMIGAKSGSARRWKGASTTPYGSCHDVTDYAKSKDNLITLSSSLGNQDLDLSPTGNDITVNGQYTGFTPTSRGDRNIRLREKIPGLKILESPVVAERWADSSLNATFTDLPPGKYWVEASRRTGCTSWLPSKFHNNSAYLSGADRGAEAWKTVDGKYAEYQKSYDMGYVATTPPSGYVGWMYRSYCKAYGGGTIDTVDVNGLGQVFTKATTVGHKGAIIHGHVSRGGGKTNKEIMVRVSSSAGTRVIRTDITDGGGDFYIAGLATGSWTISVNSDSWRGIGRTFTGKHTISVTAGHSYGVGTLYFTG